MLLILRWLRRLFGVIDLALITLVMYPLSFIPRHGSGHPVEHLFHAWCRAFVRALDVELRLHQMNSRPLPERYILVANHPSAFEDVGIPALFEVVSLAKWQVQDWYVVGRIAKAAGTLFVDRDDRDSRQQAVEDMVEAVRSGRNLALYPEGGCKGRRLYKEFKSGAFDVSMRTGVPILPVFLHYEAQDDFEWREPQTLPQKLWHILSTVNNRANYYVFDPIDPCQFADKYAMKAAVYAKYAEWNARYLE